ncbi:N-formyl-4-amino-5-aminomethyl-2-methylpyrimidine deformylase [Microtetraspora sp. NBRC 13810]|uniref:M20/M25/M40 family metallo-hydrolase n=1 Tax=Microtetraspora sp. NBRC 13810 TaxID=3030990 RepID=UPI0024A0E4B2|nr:M20/M25/M40 family metallo-hydrolase [Microtetraspora sp. NBRC 13810]GLW09875.1 N-formyl-4-amino-5-aminomethyl-2-methylpyrimidine deformylase [Microtetraspora sp. NBRC 13810]
MSISVVDLTSQLVKTHPVFRRPTVDDALDTVARQLRKLGFDCDLRPYDGTCQITATHAFGQAGPHVVLHGHIDIEDVADEGGWSMPGLWRSGEVRSGRVYGAGSSDMLGGIATLIATVRELIGQDRLSGRITVQVVVGRHLGGAGTLALFEQSGLPGVDLAILGEPTDRHVCTAAYGFRRYRLQSRGVPGPMAFAGDGDNAATHAAIALLALDTANDRLQQLYPTRQRIRYVLPGVIRGGDDAGTSAGRALVEFAMALPPLLPEDTALGVIDDSLQRSFDTAGIPLPGYEQDGIPVAPTSLGHSGFADLIREVNPALGWCQYPCSSDARVFQDLGIPMVLYGPGNVARSKRPDEYVEAAELQESVRTLGTALIRWLSRGGA